MSADSASGADTGAEAVEQPQRVEQPPPPPPDQPGAAGAPSRAESRAAAQDSTPPTPSPDQPSNAKADTSPPFDEGNAGTDARSAEPADAEPDGSPRGDSSSPEKPEGYGSSPDIAAEPTAADGARQVEGGEASRTGEGQQSLAGDQAATDEPRVAKAGASEVADQPAAIERRPEGLDAETQAARADQQVADEPYAPGNLPDTIEPARSDHQYETADSLASPESTALKEPELAAQDGNAGQDRAGQEQSVRPSETQSALEQVRSNNPATAEGTPEQSPPPEFSTVEERSPAEESSEDRTSLTSPDTADATEPTPSPEEKDQEAPDSAAALALVATDADVTESDPGAIQAIERDGHRIPQKLTVGGIDVREYVDPVGAGPRKDVVGDQVTDPNDRAGERTVKEKSDKESRRERMRREGLRNSEGALDRVRKTSNGVQDLLKYKAPAGQPETKVCSPGPSGPEYGLAHHDGLSTGDAITAVMSAGIVITEIGRRVRGKMARRKEA